MSGYIASVSFGKDSIAMVYAIVEGGLPLDEVVFFNTVLDKPQAELDRMRNVHRVQARDRRERHDALVEASPRLRAEDKESRGRKSGVKAYGCVKGRIYRTEQPEGPSDPARRGARRCARCGEVRAPGMFDGRAAHAGAWCAVCERTAMREKRRR